VTGVQTCALPICSDQLPALIVFLAFLAGSLLWGILGALIAIPVANIIRILIREWQASRADTTGHDADVTEEAAPPGTQGFVER